MMSEPTNEPYARCCSCGVGLEHMDIAFVPFDGKPAAFCYQCVGSVARCCLYCYEHRRTEDMFDRDMCNCCAQEEVRERARALRNRISGGKHDHPK